MRTKTRRQVVGLMVGAGLMGLIGCGGDTYVATTNLTGAGQPTPVNTTATGTATATLEGSELTITGTFSGLGSNLYEVSGSSIHIQRGASGTSGGTVFSLKATTTDQRNGSFSGTQKLDSKDQDAFQSGQLYVNVFTINNQGGEIRGQFIPVKQ